jgi:hypothetical protein
MVGYGWGLSEPARSWLWHHAPGQPALLVPAATASEFAALDPLPEDVEEGAASVVVSDLGEGSDEPAFVRAPRLAGRSGQELIASPDDAFRARARRPGVSTS